MIDLKKVPKQFCDNIIIGFSQESFAVGMLNGENATFYAVTPQHAKRLSQYLAKQIEEYEKKWGVIQAEWKPGIESPIQTKDLKSDK